MKNGEGAEEKPSSAVASPFDSRYDRESDDGDDLSHYSSCGGESEYERYCSASSAMGTPSFRSFQDSDFGSMKSFRLGSGHTALKNFGVDRVLSTYNGSSSEKGNYHCNDEKDNGVLSLNRRVEDFVLGNVGLFGNLVDDNSRNDSVIGNESKENGKGEGLETDGEKDRILSDEGETSSRYDHSEGEDSMFGGDSNEERETGFYYRKTVPYHGGESGRNENQLVMNSAVAFGSDDWDDFVQERTADNALGSMSWDEIQDKRQTSIQKSVAPCPDNSVSLPNVMLKSPQNDVRTTPAADNQVVADANLAELSMSMNVKNLGRTEDLKGAVTPSNEFSDIEELTKYLGCSSDDNIFHTNNDPVKKDAIINEVLKIGENDSEMTNQEINEVMAIRHDAALENKDLGEANEEANLLSESLISHHHLAPDKNRESRDAKLFEDESSITLSSVANTTLGANVEEAFAYSFDRIEDHFMPVKPKDFELKDFYDEIVDDMEDILLDSVESTGSRLAYGTRRYPSLMPQASRDGGSGASTSGTDYAHNLAQLPRKIDRIEVVGSRQKKGDVSLSERLVGMQKYTVYQIRVWSGEDHWEVEHRYRDFHTLYFRLKKLFSDYGWTLPSPWSSVERESRKLFGNASPDVVADRSILIQECLQSAVNHPKFCSGSFNVLIDFLSLSEGVPDSPGGTQSQTPNRSIQTGSVSTLGKTISLIVEIHPMKSTKQMLDVQHYRCAGCYRNFDDGRTRVQEFVQALGWGKPRLCEYSNQLFCHSCHNNDTAVLPARVLHYWDFALYPVSQMAKSFLDSINDQPMLCVSAVNPFLFSKVPTLQHMSNVRNKIRAMMPYVRCSFRRSIYKGLGSRKYLLDSNDFFALRDLVVLSKGVFSALPAMVETVSRKIEKHIIEQCLECYDVGVPCSARQDCDNPHSLIFPFQEGEIKSCKSCKSVFHKVCFKKIATCHCGARFKRQEVKPPSANEEGSHTVNSSSNLLARTAEPNRLLANLFSKVMPGKAQIVGKQERKGGDVMLMSSLSNTTL